MKYFFLSTQSSVHCQVLCCFHCPLKLYILHYKKDNLKVILLREIQVVAFERGSTAQSSCFYLFFVQLDECGTEHRYQLKLLAHLFCEIMGDCRRKTLYKHDAIRPQKMEPGYIHANVLSSSVHPVQLSHSESWPKPIVLFFFWRCCVKLGISCFLWVSFWSLLRPQTRAQISCGQPSQCLHTNIILSWPIPLSIILQSTPCTGLTDRLHTPMCTILQIGVHPQYSQVLSHQEQ